MLSLATYPEKGQFCFYHHVCITMLYIRYFLITGIMMLGLARLFLYSSPPKILSLRAVRSMTNAERIRKGGAFSVLRPLAVNDRLSPSLICSLPTGQAPRVCDVSRKVADCKYLALLPFGDNRPRRISFSWYLQVAGATAFKCVNLHEDDDWYYAMPLHPAVVY